MAQCICIWVRAYWFSVTSFSKWLPGGHIRFFGFWTAWFRQRNWGLLCNFSFKFHVHVLCGCRQKPNDCQLCLFQNGCLVILNNVQLQSTHCYPLLWGGGILVDHWSAISSWFSWWLVTWPAPSHYLNQWWNIVDWTLGNKLQWNLNQNLHIFIQESACENVVWEMSSILFQPQCVNTLTFGRYCCSGSVPEKHTGNCIADTLDLCVFGTGPATRSYCITCSLIVALNWAQLLKYTMKENKKLVKS